MAIKRKVSTYKQIRKVFQEVYQDDNCCGPLAIALTCNVSAGKSRAVFESLGRVHRKGCQEHHLTAAAEKLGHKLVHISTDAKTIGTFAKEYPEGNYMVLQVRKTDAHVTAVRNGNIDDWVDDRPGKRITKVWRVEEIS